LITGMMVAGIALAGAAILAPRDLSRAKLNGEKRSVYA